MSRLSTAWFVPDRQPNPDAPVEFLLRPLSMPALHDIRAGWKDGKPNGEGFAAGMRASVVGWKNILVDGEPLPFSQDALEEFISAVNLDFFVWSHEVVFHAIQRVMLSEAEKKTS